MSFHYKQQYKNRLPKKMGVFLVSLVILFFLIGFMTAGSSSYRLSSNAITNWTNDIDSSVFLRLLGMENRALLLVHEEENSFRSLSSTLFHLTTSIKPNDFRSLLGNELPGFSIFDTEILIAGEGTDYTNLPVESSFPLEDVLEDREAVYEEGDEEAGEREGSPEQGETKENVVFIYNTHNRESFLPHLPGISDPDSAHHDEVNITMVSKRLQQALAEKGIGAIVDETDIIGEVLVEKGWEYWQSYHASREVVSAALTKHKELQFTFDLHRDSIARELTTKNINGEDYARVMFVIGVDNPDSQKNTQLAKTLHEALEAKYPGLSRGVVPQGGAGNNGVYNQDLSENALLLEIGGIGNTLEEAYRTAEAIAEVFSDYYWDAEAVQGNGGGN